MSESFTGSTYSVRKGYLLLSSFLILPEKVTQYLPAILKWDKAKDPNYTISISTIIFCLIMRSAIPLLNDKHCQYNHSKHHMDGLKHRNAVFSLFFLPIMNHIQIHCLSPPCHQYTCTERKYTAKQWCSQYTWYWEYISILLTEVILVPLNTIMKLMKQIFLLSQNNWTIYVGKDF